MGHAVLECSKRIWRYRDPLLYEGLLISHPLRYCNTEYPNYYNGLIGELLHDTDKVRYVTECSWCIEEKKVTIMCIKPSLYNEIHVYVYLPNCDIWEKEPRSFCPVHLPIPVQIGF